MFEGTTFAKTMYISERLLDTYSMRAEVIADNIANANTPNFKRSDVTFEAEMKRALDANKQPAVFTRMTDPRHIPFQRPRDIRAVESKIAVEYDTSTLNNKNNVDVDKEMNDESVNAMRYQMFTQLMGNQYRQVKRMIGVS